MQKEKPGTNAARLAKTLGVSPVGVKCSGGQFENFRRGWAKHIMSNSRRAHYFTRDSFGDARSFCGLRASVRWLYGPGNWDRCAKCGRAGKVQNAHNAEGEQRHE